MIPTVAQHCFNHSGREAAARCPHCGRSFCRECVTEHDDRVICAACLAQLTTPAGRGRRTLGALLTPLRCAAGLLVLWIAFYLLGQALLGIPSAVHEGVLWDEASGPGPG